METLRASTYYGDWGGTAAADEAYGQKGLMDYLESQQVKDDDEFLLAASFYKNNLGVGLQAYLYRSKNLDFVREELDSIKGAIPVRRVHLEMTMNEFLDLFDRFKITLTWDNYGLEGREYEVSS
jgi:hypothetical protein